MLWVFVVLHFFLYPASNAYNSYFDKDEKSIGGLRNPPPVKKGLYAMALLMDALGLILGTWKLSLLFASMVLVYGLVSKAYSHPSIRLKKYPIAGWMVTGFFQGFFTFLMCYAGINNFGLENLFQAKVMVPAALTTLMLWANYPMTQVYQHEEDAARGDNTLSLKLGIRGTFYFAAIFFLLSAVGFGIYFASLERLSQLRVFGLALTPVIIYFGSWFFQVMKDPHQADYRHTMSLNLISSTCLNAFFIWYFFDVSHVGQYLF